MAEGRATLGAFGASCFPLSRRWSGIACGSLGLRGILETAPASVGRGVMDGVSSLSEPKAGQMITPTLRLERPLGEGGMGSVWVADHLGLQTQVVVKFMAEEIASTEEGKNRFSREAAATAQVRSPHVVQTLDYGVTDDNVPYLVMELLEGHDLGHEIERCRKLPPETVVAIVIQLSRRCHACTSEGSSIAISSRTTSSCAMLVAARSSSSCWTSALRRTMPPRVLATRPTPERCSERRTT